jgi:glutamate 5-kinase
VSRPHLRVIGPVTRVVVKVGSSLLTEGRQLSEPKIDALAEEICAVADQGGLPLIVTSGAIAAGAGRLQLPRRPRTIPEKQAAAAIGQSYLMWAYEQAFSRRGRQVAQILLTQDDFADRRRFLNAQNTLATLLEHRVIPVINENDTVAVDEIRVGDNDTLSATVACLVGADLLVLLSDVAGLYTADPRHDPAARLVPTVEGIDAALLETARGTSSSVGTGGMRTKLRAARTVTDFGIPMVIADGRSPDTLRRLLAGGEIGTLFLPAQQRIAGKKHWIRHTLAPAGDILVDAGAARAILQGGKSLLPAGVTGTSGEFDAGDPVRVVGPDGREVARGLTRYGAAAIAGIRGEKTAKVRCLACYTADEVVHRDEMVITATRET